MSLVESVDVGRMWMFQSSKTASLIYDTTDTDHSLDKCLTFEWEPPVDM
jgi:hypothetical protein